MRAEETDARTGRIRETDDTVPASETPIRGADAGGTR